MEFLEEYYHPAQFPQVWEMFKDPAFTELRLKKARLRDLEVTVDEAARGFSITATGTVDPSMVPSQVQRFVRGDISLRLVETWQADDDGAHGSLSVKIEGAPVRISSVGELSPSPKGTLRVMKGDLQVNVPLLGARLEKEAIRMVPKLAEGEQEAARVYLEAQDRDPK